MTGGARVRTGDAGARVRTGDHNTRGRCRLFWLAMIR
jgi:hypothetical protein